MGILGNVESDWFARLAHGCQSMSQSALNFISGNGRWGDRLYTQMHHTADDHIEQVNQQAINRALAGGATAHQALAAATASLDKIAAPKNMQDLADLAGHGTAIATRTVGELILPLGFLKDIFKKLAWLLSGFGLLGGAYCAATSLPGDTAKKCKHVLGKAFIFALAGAVIGAAVAVTTSGLGLAALTGGALTGSLYGGGIGAAAGTLLGMIGRNPGTTDESDIRAIHLQTRLARLEASRIQHQLQASLQEPHSASALPAHNRSMLPGKHC